MQPRLQSIWSQTLARLARELEDPSFETWLEDSRPLHLDNETLVIQFPNVFLRDWVESRYIDALQDTIRDISGETWHLSFVLPTATRATATNGGPKQPPAAPRETWSGAPLTPRYTFESFVVGSGNRFAHAAALAVAEAPADSYNPLFIYGGVGLGKTHLMQAIGHHVLDQHHHLKVVYVSSEKFTNELINAIGRKTMVEFRNKYRNVDVLLIDDIQFVAGKESTQEEFFHTFNTLYEANKQIVISSDRPPKEIPTLEERLRSRFEWGLTADIQAPDLETRIAILRKKAATDRMHIPHDVLAFIANQIHSNIRELEGALIRVLAHADMIQGPATVELASQALRDLIRPKRRRQLTILLIQETVARHFHLSAAEMKTKKRTRAVSFPRQLAMYLARELTDASLPKIGEEFGGRDHTTVIHACEKIRVAVQEDPSLAATVQELQDEIEKG